VRVALPADMPLTERVKTVTRATDWDDRLSGQLAGAGGNKRNKW
jgi:hypothetical protein